MVKDFCKVPHSFPIWWDRQIQKTALGRPRYRFIQQTSRNDGRHGETENCSLGSPWLTDTWRKDGLWFLTLVQHQSMHYWWLCVYCHCVQTDGMPLPHRDTLLRWLRWACSSPCSCTGCWFLFIWAQGTGSQIYVTCVCLSTSTVVPSQVSGPQPQQRAGLMSFISVSEGPQSLRLSKKCSFSFCSLHFLTGVVADPSTYQ